MARVSVFRVTDEGLSRLRWDFEASIDRDGFCLTLDGYGIERRRAARGRFSQAANGERWRAIDERRYYSGIERPVEIPDDVLEEAWASVPKAAYIGWKTDAQRQAA